MKITQKLTLDQTHSHLAAEWHPTLNGNDKPEHFTKGSHKKIWWQCPKYMEDVYQAYIYNRANNKEATNCPYCDGKKIADRNCLFTTHPHLMDEWSEKNIISPKNISAGTDKKAFWICKNCNNEYLSSIYHRANGHGCPYCPNNSKKISNKNSFLINGVLSTNWIWSSNNNLTPDKVSYKSDNKINFTHTICNKDTLFRVCQVEIISCKYSNSIGSKSPYLLKEWDFIKNNIDPFEISNGSAEKAHWICSFCNYNWS